MFLSHLSENEKELFLNLCGHAVMADGIVEPEEMEYLSLCCHEMGIPNQLPDISQEQDEIIENIVKTATAYDKKIILFELILLFKYDGKYAEEEMGFTRPVMNAFGIPLETHDKMVEYIDRYMTVYSDICNLLDE